MTPAAMFPNNFLPGPAFAVIGGVSGRSHKEKGEHFLPFATRENEREDARLYIEAMPQLPCKVTGFYVNGEVVALPEPEELRYGQPARCEIPERLKKSLGSLNAAAVGIFASVEGTRVRGPGLNTFGMHWKLPIGARIVRERVATSLTIPTMSTVNVQWAPEAAFRFKRFAIEVTGPKDKLFLNDLRIGKDSLLLSSTPVPLAVVAAPGGVELPDLIPPGIIVTMSFSNVSSEEIVLGGGIVFENAAEEHAALEKKYLEAVERVQETIVEGSK
jgi:hypothetical protein